MEDWPPAGFTEPKEMEDANRAIVLLIAVTSAAPLFYFLSPAILELGNPIREILQIILNQLNVTSTLAFYAVIILLFTLYFLFLIFSIWHVLIPIHERIHFEMYRLQGLNPEYTHENFLMMRNPAVIANNTGLTRLQNILSAISPLIIIGSASVTGVFVFDGTLAGLAALVLIANTAASCSDIYKFVLMLRMPKGALFANHKNKDNFTTEYATPIGDSG